MKLKKPDVMTELWDVKDRLSQEARQDVGAYCARVTNEARKKGFLLISSIPERMETIRSKAVAESHTPLGPTRIESGCHTIGV